MLDIWGILKRRLRVNRCHPGHQCRRCGGVRCQNTHVYDILTFLLIYKLMTHIYSYDLVLTGRDDIENGPQLDDGQLLTSE